MERRRYGLRSQAKRTTEVKKETVGEKRFDEVMADYLRRSAARDFSSSDEDEIPPFRPADVSKMTEPLAESPPPIPLPDLKIEPVERPQSPETNCAICLEEFDNKAYTNSCYHEFCYQCLREWSKIKPECPLCKQRFTTIIHTIRNEEYEEYHVEVPHNGGGLGLDHSVLINFAFQRTPVPSYPYRNTLSFRRLMEDEDVYHSRTMLSHPPLLYIHPSSLTRIAPENNEPSAFDPDFGSISLGSSRNRRDIYRHNRWVRPSTTGRFRESSPEFYRLNPAQTHRLVPWLTRELNVLLDISIDPQAFVDEIIRLITMFPICSRQFQEAMQPALGERTDHFIHEFYNFAISTHDMITYDMVATYEIPTPGSLPLRLHHSETDSDSDVEVVRVTPKVEGQPPLLDLSRAGPSSSSSRSLGEGIVITISDSSSDSEVEIVSMPPPPPPETIVIDDSTESENESTPEFLNGNFDGRNPPVKVDYGHRAECSRGAGIHMLNHIEDELVDYRNTSSYENVSRSPTPPMPYLRPINSKEPTSPSTSNSISICNSSRYSSTPTPSSSSSSSTTIDSSSSDSDYSDHIRKRNAHRRKRKKPSNSKRDKTPKKKLRKSVFKVDYSSSDEEYQPRSSRPRLRSVVVKPETSRAKRSQRCSNYIFPHSD